MPPHPSPNRNTMRTRKEIEKEIVANTDKIVDLDEDDIFRACKLMAAHQIIEIELLCDIRDLLAKDKGV